MLLTEYQNVNAFVGREAVVASILRDLPSATPGLVRLRSEELYETVETRVFVEQPQIPTRRSLNLSFIPAWVNA